MKLTPKPKTKTNDIHLRVSKQKREELNKICFVKECTITKLFENYIQDLANFYKI